MAQQALHTSPPSEASGFDWLGTVRGIITAPSATFARLADAQPWRQGLAFYLAVTLASALLNLLTPGGITPAGADPDLSGVRRTLESPAFQLLSAFVVSPLVLLALTGLLYQIGLRQGGDGPYARLFTTEVFSAATVSLVTMPLTVILLAAPRDAATGIGPFDIMVGLGIIVWSLMLTVFSVRASMRLSTGSAVGVLVISVFAIVFFFAMAFCALGAVFSSMLR